MKTYLLFSELHCQYLQAPPFVMEKYLFALYTTVLHEHIKFPHTPLAPFQIFAFAQWNFFSYKRIILYDYKDK